MKSYLGLIGFTVFSLLRGFSFGRESSDLLDLNQVAGILKFPQSQLIISDYLETEKAAYTMRTASENESNQAPPVNAKLIYKSYSITSKTKNTFLPIVITLSKPEAYLTPKVKKLVDDFESHAKAKRSKGNFFPYGKFDLTGAFKGVLFPEETRVIADLSEIGEPNDTSTWVGKFVTKIPAIVSIGRIESSEVDIRITQEVCFPNSEQLIKVNGGQDYFAVYNDDPEDDPKETPILSIFKGLNQIVLTSPIMDPYRKSPASPNIPRVPKDESLMALPMPPVSQKLPTQSPAVGSGNSKSSLQIWLYLLLLLGCGGVVVAWLRKMRR